ncbi:GntR family transcriptional regulator [Saccharibacillus brassicae]|uniref:GntR family transcriptional regulator n=1 Tax=Saccharibacillus brassicae TaxID=2583377 RepID=A0A4Y6V304_SACBS|nr:GntR family transcriptional regulator [Saccharibacillus brassicae]QDH23026.1 GntR family transcriptional regulator [Saccharibacillus brassicae]
MKELSSSIPMYEKIFNETRSLIETGVYRSGDKIPSEKELADAYNVSRITSKKALDLLAAEGAIVRMPGRGSFVSPDSPDGPRPGRAASAQTAERAVPAAKEKMIGLVLTDFSASYGTRLLYSMEEFTRKNDCFLVLRRTFGDQASEESAIQKMRGLGVDGLIVFPAQGEYFNAEILKLVIAEFPLVLIDRKLKGVAAASISTDNAEAAALAVNHLFELGHRNIALLSPPPRDTTAIEERIEGFVRAHADCGIAADRGLWMNDITATLPDAFYASNIEQEIQRIAEHLESHPDITAFFAIEYYIALLAKAAAERLGKKVPQDLSIVCFDSPTLNVGEGYLFTHIRQKEEEMGRLAIESVLGILAGTQPAAEVRLPAELVPGSSTAAARKG